MRRGLIAVNVGLVLVCGLFLAYTFFADAHLSGLARDFVTERTVRHSAPLVDAAEESLNSRLVQSLLSEPQQAVVRREIQDFRRDPESYIADLTRRPDSAELEVAKSPLLKQVAGVKEKIRQFYRETLNSLIADLRIFAFSNLCAAFLALWLVWRTPSSTPVPIAGLSTFLVIAVVYCSLLYVDNLTFFRILFRLHMGWRYAVLLGGVAAWMWWQHRQAGTSMQDRDGEASK